MNTDSNPLACKQKEKEIEREGHLKSQWIYGLPTSDPERKSAINETQHSVYQTPDSVRCSETQMELNPNKEQLESSEF